MHHDDITREIVGNNAIDHDVAYSPELHGRECIGCLRALPYNHFRRDASFKDGRRHLCISCEDSPRLSTEEHTARLREDTFNSAFVQRQRWEHQSDYKNDEARYGRRMSHADFLTVLKKLVPSLYITEGNIAGELAIFRTYGTPQPDLEGRTFRYLFYCPTGILPEFSLYEFDTVRDIPIKEKHRGWRTVLLRLIKLGMLSEETCLKVFGDAVGPGSTVWHRTLHSYRNLKSPISSD